MKFTQEIKDKWIEALESGKYIHGRYCLKERNTHCCLGVLAEIHPDISISDNGTECIVDSKSVGYGPFLDMFPEHLRDLWLTNDNAYSYAPAIRIIKTIPVQE